MTIDLQTLKDVAATGGWGLAATIAALVCWAKWQACQEREQQWWKRLDEERQQFLAKLSQVS